MKPIVLNRPEHQVPFIDDEIDEIVVISRQENRLSDLQRGRLNLCQNTTLVSLIKIRATNKQRTVSCEGNRLTRSRSCRQRHCSTVREWDIHARQVTQGDNKRRIPARAPVSLLFRVVYHSLGERTNSLIG